MEDSTDAVVLVKKVQSLLWDVSGEEATSLSRRVKPVLEQLLSLLTPTMPGDNGELVACEEVSDKLADALAAMYHDGSTVARLLRDRRRYRDEIANLRDVASTLADDVKTAQLPRWSLDAVTFLESVVSSLNAGNVNYTKQRAGFLLQMYSAWATGDSRAQTVACEPYCCPETKIRCTEGCRFGCIRRDQPKAPMID